MKKIIRKRKDGSIGYGFYDFKIDMVGDISWHSLNYLKEYKFNDDWPGVIRKPAYASYPFSKKSKALWFFENRRFFFDIVIVSNRI